MTCFVHVNNIFLLIDLTHNLKLPTDCLAVCYHSITQSHITIRASIFDQYLLKITECNLDVEDRTIYFCDGVLDHFTSHLSSNEHANYSQWLKVCAFTVHACCFIINESGHAWQIMLLVKLLSVMYFNQYNHH